MADIRFGFFPLTVDDVDAALEFYRDALGLSVLNDVSGNGWRWLSMGVPEQAAFIREPPQLRSGVNRQRQ